MIDVTTERLMTLKQAAELLHVTVRTIHRHIDRGLEVRRIGGRIYTSREAIHRFSTPVEVERKQEPTAPVTTRRAQAVMRALYERHGIKLGDRSAG